MIKEFSQNLKINYCCISRTKIAKHFLTYITKDKELKAKTCKESIQKKNNQKEAFIKHKDACVVNKKVYNAIMLLVKMFRNCVVEKFPVKNKMVKS